MGGPPLDEGVANLERFIGVLTSSINEVQETTSTIESHSEALDDLEDTVADKVGGFGDDLEGLLGDLNSAQEDAVEEVEKVGETARDLTDDRFGDASGDIDQAESGFEEKLKSGREDLEEDHSNLTSEGFEALGSTLDTVQDAFDASRQEADRAFTTLEEGVQDFESRGEAAFSGAGAKVEAASADLADKQTSIETDASDCVQGFEEAASQFEGECASLQGELEGTYSTATSEVEAEAQDLIDWDHTLIEDTAGYVAAGLTDQLEAGVALVLNESLAQYMDELSKLATSLEGAEATASELEPLVAELEKSKQVVDTVDELLNAIE